MPEALEQKLKAEAKKMKLKGKKADSYIYGTMRKTSPSSQPYSTKTPTKIWK